MSFWRRIFNRKPKLSLGDISNRVAFQAALSRSDITTLPAALEARQRCLEENTFETGERNPPVILCSDNECPCTDGKPLTLGRTAYLYISAEVINFRKDCRTLFERDNLLLVANEGRGNLVLAGGLVNPFYLCEIGARRRGLDLAVALRDAETVASTGFAPLRPTPLADDHRARAFSHLLTQVFGDRAAAERLIAFEHKANPSASEVECIEAASRRIVEDNTGRWR